MFEPLQPILRAFDLENNHNKAYKNLASDVWSSQEHCHPHNHCRQEREPECLSFSNDIYQARLDKQRESNWFPRLRIEDLPFGGMHADPLGRLLEAGARNDAQLFSDLHHDFDRGAKHIARNSSALLDDLSDGNLPNFIDDVGHGLVDDMKDVVGVVGDIGGAIDRGLRSIFSFL